MNNAMTDFLNAHTWMCCSSIFWTPAAAFMVMMFVGGIGMLLWMAWELLTKCVLAPTDTKGDYNG